MRRARWQCLICGVVVAVLAGCPAGSDVGIDTVPVSGTVTLDGQPVEGATVSFGPKAADGRAAVGATDATGRFNLTTVQAGDGALPGGYAVTVTKIAAPQAQTVSGPPAGGGGQASQEQMQQGMKKMAQMQQEKMQKSGGRMPAPSAPANLLPTKYASAESSGFTAEVKKGETNQFTFAMTSK